MVLEYTQIVPQAGTMVIRHLNQTFRLINDRISSTGRLSVATLAVVMALSTYESSRGFYDQGMIHASGVFQMVEMRGMAWFATEAPELFAKLFRYVRIVFMICPANWSKCRADLDFALRLGTPTKLDITALEKSHLMEKFDFGTLNKKTTESSSMLLANLDNELLRLWNGFSILAARVNEASKSDNAKLPVMWFALAHVWLGHRLLDYAPLLGSRPMGHVESMVHLGLATMVNSFVCGIDRRVAENDILVSLIKEHAHLNELSGSVDYDTLKLLLWLLYIGSAVVIQSSRHDAWLITKTRETMWALDISTWDEVQCILSSHPWIHDLYDQRAHALYHRTTHIDGIQALSLISPT
jgi:hypothetical protein